MVQQGRVLGVWISRVYIVDYTTGSREIYHFAGEISAESYHLCGSSSQVLKEVPVDGTLLMWGLFIAILVASMYLVLHDCTLGDIPLFVSLYFMYTNIQFSNAIPMSTNKFSNYSDIECGSEVSDVVF